MVSRSALKHVSALQRSLARPWTRMPVVTRKPEATWLRETARRLRAIAATFEYPIVRGDVLRLAEKCEEPAKSAETAQRSRHDNC
jgi:hypothetical protein